MKSIRIKLTADHKVQTDAQGGVRTYPAGLAFTFPEDDAHAIVKAGKGTYVNSADAEKDDGAEDDLTKMKKDELEALAADRHVNITECRTKADIIAALNAAEAAKA